MHPQASLDLAKPGGLIQEQQLRVGVGRGYHSVSMWLTIAAAGPFKVSDIAHSFMWWHCRIASVSLFERISRA